MPVTTWVLCDEDGTPVTEVANASTRVFKAARNTGRQGVLTFSHDDREARDLFRIMRNGVPQLRYYRADEDGEKQLRLSAYLTSVDEALGEDSEARLTATFKDPFGRILGDGSGDSPGRVLLVPLTFTAQDQGSIAWALIEALDLDGATGLVEGAIEATTTRDRQYAVGKNVGEAIEQLTEVLGGFDFEVLPLDPLSSGGALGAFTVYADQGSVRADLLWGFGKGTIANVRQVTRKITPPVNRVHMVTSDGLSTIKDSGASRMRFGEWAVSRSAPNDVVLQATLDQQAVEALRYGWVKVMKFQPDPDIGPQPFDDYWLGDTGKVKVTEGAFLETGTARVTALQITEDADGQEEHELETEVFTDEE